MNYACRSPAADRLVTSSVARQAAGRGLRSPRRLVGQLLRQRIIFHTYWSLPRAADFEASPDAPREDRVLFQTRVWDPSDVLPDNPEQINGTRVEVVRALRREFGPRFLGGLVPTPFAQRNWPELITNASTRRRDFIQLVKTSRVLVYTRGLHHSIAFKLPEYLAASGAIAAEPIRNEVPADQVGWGGVGAAQDDTREASGHAPAHPTRALVESAALYMSDPVLADGARAASWSCYQRAVRPGAGVLHHLTAAAADACPTAGDQPTEASTA